MQDLEDQNKQQYLEIDFIKNKNSLLEQSWEQNLSEKEEINTNLSMNYTKLKHQFTQLQNSNHDFLKKNKTLAQSNA
jgi:hypothetical protein